MIPYVTASSPPVTVTAPGRSSRAPVDGRSPRSASGVTSRISAATGTLTKNAARQPSRLDQRAADQGADREAGRRATRR